MTTADSRATTSAPLILLVDDNADSRDVTGMLLDHKGYRVAYAGSVAEALTQIRKETPAAIVTDLSMPQLSGLDLVDRLKAAAPTANIPMIVVSGHTQVEVRQQAYSAGVKHFFAKPIVDLDGFMRALADAVAR